LPTYLLTAESIISDGDVDLLNDYALQRYLLFYPYPLTPATSSLSATGHLYTVFSPGLPLVIVPAYALGKVLGAPRLAVSLFMGLVMALTAVNIYLLAYETAGDAPIALVTWVILSFICLPILSHSFEIYPDIIAALIVIYVFRQLLRWPELNFKHLFLTGLVLSYANWVHPKNLASVGVLLLVALLQTWRSGRNFKAVFVFGSPVAFSLLLHSGFNALWYGVFSPEGGLSGSSSLAFETLRTSLWGLLLDRREGLLGNAPIYFLALASLLSLLVQRKVKGPYLAGLISANFTLVALSVAWWKGGGGAFPNRHLLSMLPLAALPLAHYLANAKTLLLRIALLMAVLLNLVGLVGFFRDPTNLLRGGYSIYDLSYILPDAHNFTAASVVLLASWGAFLLVVGILLMMDLQSTNKSLKPRWLSMRPGLQALAAFFLGLLMLPLSQSRTEFIRASAATQYAPEMANEVGKLIDDPLASKGKAVYCNGENGWMSIGAWGQLPSGSYRIQYRLKLPSAQSRVSMEVVTYPDARQLAVTSVSGPSNGYELYTFIYQSHSEGLLSFRAFCHPGQHSFLDSISVIPLSQVGP